MVRNILKGSGSAATQHFIVRLDEQDVQDPVLQTQLFRLQSYLSTKAGGDADPELEQEFSALRLRHGDWRGLRVLDENGQDVELKVAGASDGSGMHQGKALTELYSTEPEKNSPTIFPRLKAAALVSGFWSQILARGIEGMEKVILLQVSDNDHSNRDVPVNLSTVIQKKDARRNVKAFYSGVLKRALDRLQNSIVPDSHGQHSDDDIESNNWSTTS